MLWQRRWAPLVAVVALLGAAMLAAVYADPVIDFDRPVTSSFTPDRPSDQPTRPRPTTVQGLDRGTADIPLWVTYLVSALCLFLVLVLLSSLAWAAIRTRLSRRRRLTDTLGEAVPTLERTRQAIQAVVDAGLADLDDDGDPRRAVIACWVRLEQASAAAGVERGVGDTSSELVARLLAAELVIRADVLEGLAAIYREARYAPHVIDASMRERARAALLQLRRELAGGEVRPAAVGDPS